MATLSSLLKEPDVDNGFWSRSQPRLPYAIEPVQSGNLLDLKSYKNDLVMFFGIAAPTAWPLYKGAGAP
jgi:hypothetical protein